MKQIGPWALIGRNEGNDALSFAPIFSSTTTDEKVATGLRSATKNKNPSRETGNWTSSSLEGLEIGARQNRLDTVCSLRRRDTWPDMKEATDFSVPGFILSSIFISRFHHCDAPVLFDIVGCLADKPFVEDIFLSVR
jgi:hypothetical protein